MQKSRRTTWLVVAVLAAGLTGFVYLQYRAYLDQLEKNRPQREEVRNVYLITAAGLRPDHLSSYMYQSIQTPALDFLAYDGIRITDAWTTSPESLPAHLSLLTGMYPFHAPVSTLLQRYYLGSSTRTPSTGLTMPDWFRKKGYRTAAFLADPDLRIPALVSRLFEWNATGDRQAFSWEAGYSTEQACNLAYEWIEKNIARPHFLLLSLNEPTPPYAPPSPFDRHYSSHPYDGEIAALDEQIGLFINRLKSSGLFERSIIVFAAPYALGPEEDGAGAPLRNERLQIPLFVVAPGLLPRQKTYASQVSLVDVFPTVVSLLGFDPAPLKLDGLPLFVRGSDQEITRDTIFGGSFQQSVAGVRPSYFAHSPGWKLIAGNPDQIFSSSSDTVPSTTQVAQKMTGTLQDQLRQLNPAITLPPGSGKASEETAGLLKQALFQARTGHADEAFRVLEEAEAELSTPFALRFVSELAEATGRLQEAAELIERAGRWAAFPELQADQARIRFRALQFRDAERLQEKFDRAAESLSYYDYHMIGIIRLHRGDPARAVTAFDRALELNPRFLPSMLGKIDAWERLGEKEKALSGLQEAESMFPSDSVVTRRLAFQILQGPAPQNAAPLLKRVLDSDPADLAAMLHLAKIEGAAGNAQEAARLYRQILLDARDPVLADEARKGIAQP